MRRNYDVIVVGAGPAGSSCAAFCAAGGLRTLIIEKSIFPREKVCGDCLNPGCWPVLDRLAVSHRILALPHSKLELVEIAGFDGRSLQFPIEPSDRGEVAVKRADFDHILLRRAIECGADFREGSPVTRIEEGWTVHSEGKVFTSRILIAADGRNSTVARLLGYAPASARDRVAIQTHIDSPAEFGERVVLRLRPEGYCGIASIGDGQLNLCLVSTARKLAKLRAWAEEEFGIPTQLSWQSIAPLARRKIVSYEPGFYLIGDAARVVEPFTGEGIFYALASGWLAARHLLRRAPAKQFRQEQAALYRGRLWVNQFAKQAVLHPRLGNGVLNLMHRRPELLRYLTAKVIGDSLR